MKFLVCTDIFRNGGLETNIVTFSEYFKSKGHEVYLCTGEESKDYVVLYKKLFKKVLYLKNPLFYNWESFVQISEEIKNFVNKNQIDLLIIHPFLSFIYAVKAAVSGNIPYVLFFHGPASVSPEYNPGYKEFYDLWMDNIAIKNSVINFCVSEEAESLLKSTFPYSQNKTKILRNPVPNLKRFMLKGTKEEDKRYVVMATRVDDVKFDSIIAAINFFCKMILPKNKSLDLHIIGDGNRIEELKEYIKAQKISNYIKLLGFKEYDEVLKIISKSDLVLGMGRTCIEGLLLGKRVILVGYDGIKGEILLSNIKSFGERNFSGREFSNITQSQISESLKDYESVDKSGYNKQSGLYKYARENYSVDVIGEVFLKVLLKYCVTWVAYEKNLGNKIDILSSFWQKSKLENILEGKNAELEIYKDRDTELTIIKKSRAWRFVERYYKFVHFLKK